MTPEDRLESLIDRLKADLEFAKKQADTTGFSYNAGYVAGLERAIEVLTEYDN